MIMNEQDVGEMNDDDDDEDNDEKDAVKINEPPHADTEVITNTESA